MKVKEKIQFGQYYVDAEGKVLEPISWIVLSKTKEEMLLISEQIIDYMCFSSSNSNDWDRSDIKKWLNEEFVNIAFNKEEKERILEADNNELVSLLDFDSYFNSSYFPNYKSLKATYSDYAKEKTKNIYGKVTSYEYGFYWLKSPNPDDKKNIYVFHVCNTGKLNEYEQACWKDGVRPVIRIKI